MIPKRWINSRNRKKSTLLKRLSKLKNVKKRWGEKAMLETMPISEKLKMLRDRHGLTLDELAERTGLSRSALSNYETNESKEVSQFALVALAKFYGVSTDYLLGLSALENPMQGDIHDLNISSRAAQKRKNQQPIALRNGDTSGFSEITDGYGNHGGRRSEKRDSGD